VAQFALDAALSMVCLSFVERLMAMARKSMTNLSPRKKADFLAQLAHEGNVTIAAASIGYSRQAVYLERNKDALFAAGWDDAMQQFADSLEHVAKRRAIEGESDTLLIFLLKGARPEKYRENVKVQASVHTSVVPAPEDVPSLRRLRDRFGDRPELLAEIAASIGANEEDA
jgi:AcrR family transcriptional regulator